jgi:hypothetical protein
MLQPFADAVTERRERLEKLRSAAADDNLSDRSDGEDTQAPLCRLPPIPRPTLGAVYSVREP